MWDMGHLSYFCEECRVGLTCVNAPLGYIHAPVSRDDDGKAESYPDAEQEDQEAEAASGERKGKGWRRLAEACLMGRHGLVVAGEPADGGVLCAQ
jgi:hypothetical protein